MLYAKRGKSKILKRWESFLGKCFSLLPFSPNFYTLLALLFAILTGALVFLKNFLLASATFLAAGAMDLIDGAVARRKKLASKKGAYLDTVVDRYVEIIVFLSLLSVNYPCILFPSRCWIGFFMANALMVSYVKAAGKEKEMVKSEVKGGMLERGERMALLFLVLLLSGFSKYAAMLLVIAGGVLSFITSLQRIRLVMRRAK